MKKIRLISILSTIMALISVFTACGSSGGGTLLPAKSHENVKQYIQKAELLKPEVTDDLLLWEIGDEPIDEIGHAVFISVCDTTKRADVYTGVGKTAEEAWKAADEAAQMALAASGLTPEWVKADIVYLSKTVSLKELEKAVYSARHEFFRYGAAFDKNFDTALLEAEMNGAKIYEYEKGGIDLSYLNTYLEKSGRTKLESVPNELILFKCFGWLCDENGVIWELDSNDLDHGRRTDHEMNKQNVEQLIYSASDFLVDQIQPDGKFIYGYYPRFGNTIENYNIVRHSSTIWSLLCRYRMQPSEQLASLIESTVDYMLTQVVYETEDTAYIIEEKDQEIKLGANGVAVIALAEYMDIFRSDRYKEECEKLGNGILAMMDIENGSFCHVLNADFTVKEDFRTVYYDGEATFALCKLYALTGDQKWLDAAQSAVDRFIDEDYTRYKDHWIAYSLNEITKHIPDRADYYSFALRNVKVNMDEIYNRDTTYHTYLELLMASFETYDRMLSMGAKINNFDDEMFLKTIAKRADHMLNGFFYPEYAMYMQNPQQIEGSFMVRHDGYRVRIDDVQHNIGGYYLYWKNYEKLTAYGMEPV